MPFCFAKTSCALKGKNFKKFRIIPIKIQNQPYPSAHYRPYRIAGCGLKPLSARIKGLLNELVSHNNRFRNQFALVQLQEKQDSSTQCGN